MLHGQTLGLGFKARCLALLAVKLLSYKAQVEGCQGLTGVLSPAVLHEGQAG